MTLSIDIAIQPDDAIDAGSLERAADRALFAAKNAGRDRIEMFGSELSQAATHAEIALTNGNIDHNLV